MHPIPSSLDYFLSIFVEILYITQVLGYMPLFTLSFSTSFVAKPSETIAYPTGLELGQPDPML